MFVLVDSQFVQFGFQSVDAVGNPATVENVVVKSSDESIVTVTGPDVDGKFTATAQGPLGTVQLSASADAIVGEGEELIFGTADIQVVAGKAVAINFQFGQAQEKAPA